MLGRVVVLGVEPDGSIAVGDDGAQAGLRDARRATTFRVIDDDGVLVLSSASALVDAPAREAQPAFPGVLGELVREGRAMAWQYDVEATAEVEVEVAPAPPTFAAGPQRLRLDGAPAFLLPYSAFTMALRRGGAVERIHELFAEIPLPGGSYLGWVRPIGSSGFRVTLVPSAADATHVASLLTF